MHNHETGTVHVAHAGAWHKLLLDASGGAITNYTDPLKSVAYVGNINSLSDVDTTSTAPQTGNVLKWDGGKWAPGTDATTGGAGTDADTLDGQDGSAGQLLKANGNGTFEFTTVSTGGSQNLFATVDGDTGTTTANSTTDTLTVAGGSNITTQVSGDTVTINYTGDPNSGEENQNAFTNVASDSGTAVADSKTDTLTIAGGTNITTAVAGDTVTINYSGTNTLASLTDTDTSGAIAGNVLVYNGSSWVDHGQTVDQMAFPAITSLTVTADSFYGYKFDQYGNTEDPTIYCLAGATIAFKLSGLGSHPFLIQTSGGVNYDNGLLHVETTGAESTGSSAQGKTSGTLYWKVPANVSGNYQYRCSSHGAMQGTIVIKSMASI